MALQPVADAAKKLCRSCLRELSLDEFATYRKAPDGLQSRCRSCRRQRYLRDREVVREQNARWRLLNADRVRELERQRGRRRWRQDPEAMRARSRAHSAVWYARKTGQLTRPDECELCGRPGPTQAHHHDYSQPLAVVHLCPACHSQQHPQAARAA
jgi:predicted RNA-binding Zn-ribbon protein involved in translation (DUF1610 family)